MDARQISTVGFVSCHPLIPFPGRTQGRDVATADTSLNTKMTPGVATREKGRPLRRWLRRFWWFLLACLLLMVWYYKLPGLAYYWFITRDQHGASDAPAVRVSGYRVSIEGLPIAGLSRNLSGLTYNVRTGTLFSIVNRPAQVAEISTDGRLIRLIDIDGLKDPEGITYVDGNTYVISDEASHSLYWIQIAATDKRLSVVGVPRLRLGIDVVHNASLEGVSWDSNANRLFVVKEKLPLRVLVITGLRADVHQPGFDIAINEWKSSSAASLFMSDLSSLTYHEPTGNLLLLSDESALIVEYAPDGSPVDMLPLWRGLHGLKRKIPQPEGLSLGSDGAIYVLSEPNLFYRFDPPTRPVWARPN